MLPLHMVIIMNSQYCVENSGDPDQLASSADLDLHCFNSLCLVLEVIHVCCLKVQ